LKFGKLGSEIKTRPAHEIIHLSCQAAKFCACISLVKKEHFTKKIAFLCEIVLISMVMQLHDKIGIFWCLSVAKQLEPTGFPFGLSRLSVGRSILWFLFLHLMIYFSFSELNIFFLLVMIQSCCLIT